MAESMPAGSKPAVRPKKSLDAQMLADINFAAPEAGTKELIIYIAQLQQTSRDIATEIELSASQLEDRLASSRAGARGYMDKLAARRLCNHLRKAAQYQNAVGDQGVRFLKAYMDAFMDLIRPDKKRAGWRWREDGKPGA